MFRKFKLLLLKKPQSWPAGGVTASCTPQIKYDARVQKASTLLSRPTYHFGKTTKNKVLPKSTTPAVPRQLSLVELRVRKENEDATNFSPEEEGGKRMSIKGTKKMVAQVLHSGRIQSKKRGGGGGGAMKNSSSLPSSSMPQKSRRCSTEGAVLSAPIPQYKKASANQNAAAQVSSKKKAAHSTTTALQYNTDIEPQKLLSISTTIKSLIPNQSYPTQMLKQVLCANDEVLWKALIQRGWLLILSTYDDMMKNEKSMALKTVQISQKFVETMKPCSMKELLEMRSVSRKLLIQEAMSKS